MEFVPEQEIRRPVVAVGFPKLERVARRHADYAALKLTQVRVPTVIAAIIVFRVGGVIDIRIVILEGQVLLFLRVGVLEPIVFREYFPRVFQSFGVVLDHVRDAVFIQVSLIFDRVRPLFDPVDAEAAFLRIKRRRVVMEDG